MPYTHSNPGTSAISITPHDSTNIAGYIRAFRVGDISSGATMTGVNDDNTTVAFSGLTAGEVIACHFKRINTTGTLASNIIGYY